MPPVPIETWKRLVATHAPEALDRLLADGVTFHSPVVHTPQVGKAIVRKYLEAAEQVLNTGNFRYVGEWFGETSAVLEFETTVEGILINGVDLIEWNGDGQIVRFKVMVRPLKAIHLLHQLMMRALQAPSS